MHNDADIEDINRLLAEVTAEDSLENEDEDHEQLMYDILMLDEEYENR